MGPKPGQDWQSGTGITYRPPMKDRQRAKMTKAQKAALQRINAGRNRNRLPALVVDPDLVMAPPISGQVRALIMPSQHLCCFIGLPQLLNPAIVSVVYIRS
jgi:hypothetical protein